MGEQADLIINGDICEGCPCALPGNGPGYPRYCRECAKDRPPEPTARLKSKCKTCGRMVKLTGLSDHMRVMHSNPKPNTALLVWREECRKAGAYVEMGVKRMIFSEEACIRIGSAIEAMHPSVTL